MEEISQQLFTNLHIDPDKPVPFHAQVYEALDELIDSGKLKAGEQLPGEPKLCGIFGVSRTVIRQALDQLLRDGQIIRIMGKGTFVAEPKISEGLVGSLTGFYEDMVRQGYTPVSKTIRQERIGASAKVARQLKIAEGSAVILLTRLRFVDEIPLQLVTTYLPEALCPSVLDTDFTRQSLYDYLQRSCNLRVATGKRLIEAVLASKEEARLLDIQPGAPLILIDSVSYLSDGTPLEYYHAVHRSDRARFEVELIRSRDALPLWEPSR